MNLEINQEQVNTYFEIIRNPDSSLQDILDAKTGLYNSVHLLICKIAQTYADSTLNNLPDFLAAGDFGFMQAVEKYDIKKGKFSSYVWNWARKFIYKLAMEKKKARNKTLEFKDYLAGDKRVEVEEESYFNDFISMQERDIAAKEDKVIAAEIKREIDKLRPKQKSALRFYFGAGEEERKKIKAENKWKSTNAILWHKREAIKVLKKVFANRK